MFNKVEARKGFKANVPSDHTEAAIFCVLLALLLIWLL